MVDDANKLDCEKAEELLVDYIYQELPQSTRTAFERHLSECPTHASEVEQLQGVLQLVRQQQPEKVPQGLSERILQQAEALTPKPAKPFWQRLVFSPAMMAASAAAVVLVIFTIGLFIHDRSEELAPAPREQIVATPSVLPQDGEIPEAEEEFRREYKADLPAGKGLKTEERRKLQKAKRKAPKKDRGEFYPTKRTKKSVPKKKAKPASRPFEAEKTKALAKEGSKATYKQFADGAIPDTAKNQAAGDLDLEMAQKPSPRVSSKMSRQAGPRTRGKMAEERVAAVVTTDNEADVGKKPSDHYQEGERLIAQKQYRQAIQSYRRFLAQNPHDRRAASCRYRIAKAWFLLGQCKQAITAIDLAIAASPNHGMAPGALFDQASCHMKLGQMSKAKEVYEKIKRLFPAYSQDAQKGINRIK
jgi:TolA-binding protein